MAKHAVDKSTSGHLKISVHLKDFVSLIHQAISHYVYYLSRVRAACQAWSNS